MTKIFDAAKDCTFSNRKFMFDTNIWIAINGYNRPHLTDVYSHYYASILSGGNEVVINDYILGELFNRCCRIEYQLHHEDDPECRLFKRRRMSENFCASMETVRDTCLNIVDDCIYEPAVGLDYDISSCIQLAASGELDFSDVVIREHCKAKNYILVSHDSDFKNCGIELVTANSTVLNWRR